MDGEWRVIPRAVPIYRFPRIRNLSCLADFNFSVSPIWTEDYELDSWEGDRVFYRRVGLPPQ